MILKLKSFKHYLYFFINLNIIFHFKIVLEMNFRIENNDRLIELLLKNKQQLRDFGVQQIGIF
jgi:hypothetical protein